MPKNLLIALICSLMLLSACKSHEEPKETCEYYCQSDCTHAFGEVRDQEGNKYKTIVIGKETWMAENLAYAEDKHYSANGSPDNDKEYGYLYHCEKVTCPAGWCLPSLEDFEKLLYYVESHRLSDSLFFALIKKEAWPEAAGTGQNGNEFAFAALPAGAKLPQANSFLLFGQVAYFCGQTSTTEFNSSKGPLLDISFSGSNPKVSIQEYYSGTNDAHSPAYSVRCIKER